MEQVLICRSCNSEKRKPEFYAYNFKTCKECVKERVRANRSQNVEYYRSYDRMRYRVDDKRKEQARASSNSEAAAEAKKRYIRRTRTESPEKYLARNAVNNAVRDGRLEKAKECFFCSSSENLHAHHPDYSRPLDVYWLCPSCHGKVHAINGDFLKPLAAS